MGEIRIHFNRSTVPTLPRKSKTVETGGSPPRFPLFPHGKLQAFTSIMRLPLPDNLCGAIGGCVIDDQHINGCRL